MRAEGADRMTRIYDPPIGTRRGSAPPGPPPAGWPVPGSPGGPGGPYGPYGYGGGGGRRPGRRMRRKVLIFLYIVVIGLVRLLGLQCQPPAPHPRATSD